MISPKALERKRMKTSRKAAFALALVMMTGMSHSTDEKRVFMNCLREEFAPRLRDIGFKGSGQNFRRVTGDTINCINIQGNKYGGSCAVNLGLHLTFLPVNPGDELPNLKEVREVECEFRRRLAPGDKEDYWWKYKRFLSSPAKTVRHLAETYFRYGEPLFRRYADVRAVAAAVR